MEIKIYDKAYEVELFKMFRDEGEDWSCYYLDEAAKNYARALENSVTYVAFCNGVLCGYVRAKEDSGFGVYIHDLLVKKQYRGRAIGRQLMEKVKIKYGEQSVYVMSDVDTYYEKLGYRREGSIFEVEL